MIFNLRRKLYDLCQVLVQIVYTFPVNVFVWTLTNTFDLPCVYWCSCCVVFWVSNPRTLVILSLWWLDLFIYLFLSTYFNKETLHECRDGHLQLDLLGAWQLQYMCLWSSTATYYLWSLLLFRFCFLTICVFPWLVESICTQLYLYIYSSGKVLDIFLYMICGIFIFWSHGLLI